MIVKVVSGGQTGVDRAGFDAALEAGIAIGGYCPKGRLSEDGKVPDCYALTELSRGGYPARTERNVAESEPGSSKRRVNSIQVQEKLLTGPMKETKLRLNVLLPEKGPQWFWAIIVLSTETGKKLNLKVLAKINSHNFRKIRRLITFFRLSTAGEVEEPNLCVGLASFHLQ